MRYETGNMKHFKLLEINKIYKLTWEFRNLHAVVQIINKDSNSIRFKILMINNDQNAFWIGATFIGGERDWIFKYYDESYFEDLNE